MIGATNPFAQRSMPLPSNSQASSSGRAGGSSSAQQDEQLPRLKNGPVEDTFVRANSETQNTQMEAASKTATTGVGQTPWLESVKKLFQTSKVEPTQNVGQTPAVGQIPKVEQPNVAGATQKVTAPAQAQASNLLTERPAEQLTAQQQKPNAFQTAIPKQPKASGGAGSLVGSVAGAGLLTVPILAPTAMVSAPAASVKAITSSVASTLPG